MTRAPSGGIHDSVDSLTLDTARSKVTLRTYARGLLSAVAHDLELTGSFARGKATRDGDRWDGEIVIVPSAIKVVGVLKSGRVNKETLSGWETREIERRVSEEVFGGAREIVVSAKGTAESPDVRVTIRREQVVRPKIGVRADGRASIVSLRGTISMKGLGLAEVKGPLGAFSVKDDVEFDAEAVFAPA